MKTKTKEIGEYEIKIKKHYNIEKDKIIMKLEINPKLKKLINKFIVDEDTALCTNHKRFKVKNVLVNNSYFYSEFYYFFDKKLLLNGTSKFAFNNNDTFKNIIFRLPQFKDVVQKMDEIATEREIKATFTMSE